MVKTEIRTITPEIATAMLAQHGYERQRNLREYKVELLATAMTNGQFHPGAAIEFACLNGTRWLTNGQHRLSAIVRSGVTIDLPVTDFLVSSREEVDAAYWRTDRGTPRVTLDVIRAAGLADEIGISDREISNLSTAASLLSAMSKGRIASGMLRVSDDQRIILVREWAEEARRFIAAVEDAPGFSNGKRSMSNVQLMMVGIATLRHQPEAADGFWRAVATDDGLRRGNPAKTLHDYILTHAAKRANRVMYVRAISLCWNAYFQERTLVIVKAGLEGPIVIAGTPYRSNPVIRGDGG